MGHGRLWVGLGAAEQAKRLTHPGPTKEGEKLAKRMEMCQDKIRKLAAHGDRAELDGQFPVLIGQERPASNAGTEDMGRSGL